MLCRSECRLGHFDRRKPPVRSRPILADRVEATNDRYGDSGRLRAREPSVRFYFSSTGEKAGLPWGRPVCRGVS